MRQGNPCIWGSEKFCEKPKITRRGGCKYPLAYHSGPGKPPLSAHKPAISALRCPQADPTPCIQEGNPETPPMAAPTNPTVIQAPLARSGLTASGHSLAHLLSRAGGRPDDPETDTAAWGRGTRKGACSEGPIGPVAHLGVAELHHHVLAAPSRRHRQRPAAGATGLRAPTPCTRVPGLSKPHSALRSAPPRPARLVARHWLTHHWVRPLFSVPPIPAPCRPRDGHAPFSVTRLGPPSLLGAVKTRPLAASSAGSCSPRLSRNPGRACRLGFGAEQGDVLLWPGSLARPRPWIIKAGH